MLDIKIYIKEKVIEAIYDDILEFIKSKLSKLLNEQKDSMMGGATTPSKLKLRDYVRCDIEITEKPDKYTFFSDETKKNPFLIYNDDYTLIEIEKNFNTFTINDDILNLLSTSDTTFTSKNMKYIILYKYDELKDITININNKYMDEKETIKPYKNIKDIILKELNNHYNKYYNNNIINSIKYFVSPQIEDIDSMLKNNYMFNFNSTGFMIMHYLTNQYFTQYIDKSITDNYDLSSIDIFNNDNDYYNSINNSIVNTKKTDILELIYDKLNNLKAVEAKKCA